MCVGRLIKTLCGVVVAVALTMNIPGPAAQSKPKRPNVLWLIAEDFGVELGCYGTKEVWTPNLDRMAAEGMRFTRAYTTAPVCSPSRSALMTGMYQTTIGAHHHRSHRDDGYKLPAGVRVLTDRLREAGYYTANLRQLPPEAGFNGTGKTDWNFTYEGRPFDSDKWEDLKAHQPFYAQLNFNETHRTFVSPGRADPAKVAIPPYYPDHPVTREDWAKYLDAATELDGKIGKALRQLEADGLADDTIIIFFGDNGQAHVRGKQFVYESGLHVPLIIRWPKNFPAPKNFRAGAVSDQLVEAIDLTATTLAFAGVAKPKRMQGRVLFGEQAEPPRQYAFGARDRCDETVFRLRTVRDKRYRYIRNFTPDRPLLQPNQYKQRQYPVWSLLPRLAAQGRLTPAQAALTAPTMPPEELYDLDGDPYEIDNLVNSSKPEHRAALKRLRAEMNKWIETTNDQGRIPEPPEVAAAKGATKPGGNPNAEAIRKPDEAKSRP
ncbi:MAG: sulfatase family protein [Blastocatellia bacterium]